MTPMTRHRTGFAACLAGATLACVSLATNTTESVPGGEFVGSDEAVHTLAPYRLDRTEVTVRMYRACERAGHCEGTIGHRLLGCDDACEAKNRRVCNYVRPGRGDHPMDCISAAQAARYCAWRGGRLPTQWEWEWEARGGEEARAYPWGDSPPSCELAVIHDPERGCGRGTTTRVGSREAGASRHGALDLSGNVYEWVTSEDGRTATLIGGSASSPRFELASNGDAGRGEGTPIDAPVKLFKAGFRCAFDG